MSCVYFFTFQGLILREGQCVFLSINFFLFCEIEVEMRSIQNRPCANNIKKIM